MTRAARWVDVALQVVTIALLIALAVVVVLAVAFRFAGASLVWYDEVASVMLAWITYYGAALAALRRRHLGFAGFQMNLRPRARLLTFWFGEAVTYAVFVTMAWASWYVLRVMAGETLVSLDWVSLQFTQSVVPIGCTLFVLAQILSTPEALRRLAVGRSGEDEEIAEEISRARTALGAGKGDSA
ncbi:MAG: TRAP transporter small permease subunit [Thiotrichales bacterium]|nr:TRAP transporter small permease subunit [Thiotrichales bacterium]MCY4284212.1 TRAP transporter small permease subunit [Thiotrichales bacterium]MCY4350246.1 TRAP transporter small permease subunit [Thiotrichales bacterium]